MFNSKSYFFNKNNSSNAPFLILLGLMVLLLAFRTGGGVPNFTPTLAIVFFSSKLFSGRLSSWSLLLPLGALLVSDAILGFYDGMLFTYMAYALIGALGLLSAKMSTAKSFANGAVVAPLVFFILSNMGVWIMGGLYPMTWSGLVQCYVMAIPFFQATLLSTGLFLLILFACAKLVNFKFKSSFVVPNGR